MSFGKYIDLNDGNKIPQIGLGTWLSKPGEVAAAVEHAVKHGYRHLDLAKIYGNQEEIAGALKKVIGPVVKREDLFITSKLWNNRHAPDQVEAGYDETLKELGLDYLDLYLIHWPVAFDSQGKFDETSPIDESGAIRLDRKTTLVDTWKAMIELQKKGKVKSIGVSNFTQAYLEAIIQATGVVPAVNQIEAHPVLPQEDLVKFSNEKGIHITAYSPLGNPAFYLGDKIKIVDAPAVKKVAEKQNADIGQVLIAWGAKRGYSVIPKSVTPSRIESNFKQVELSDEDYEAISAVIKDHAGGHIRFNIPQGYDPQWNVNVFHEDSELSAKYQVNIGA